jgi:hypothetical protein
MPVHVPDTIQRLCNRNELHFQISRKSVTRKFDEEKVRQLNEENVRCDLLLHSSRDTQTGLTRSRCHSRCFLARTAEHDALAQGWRNREARVELVVPYLDARLGLALVQTPDLVAQPGEI